jgi:hypothetical protein
MEENGIAKRVLSYGSLWQRMLDGPTNCERKYHSTYKYRQYPVNKI